MKATPFDVTGTRPSADVLNAAPRVCAFCQARYPKGWHHDCAPRRAAMERVKRFERRQAVREGLGLVAAFAVVVALALAGGMLAGDLLVRATGGW